MADDQIRDLDQFNVSPKLAHSGNPADLALLPERLDAYATDRSRASQAITRSVQKAPTPDGVAATWLGRDLGKPVVIDGPFAETKELVAGFWLWQVRSMDEAIEWVRRCPNPMPTESEIEIRPVFEAEDFGAEFTTELRAQEDRLREQMAKNT